MFKPLNRYILIDVPSPDEACTSSGILLPDDYRPDENPYVVVRLIDFADDVRFEKKLKELVSIRDVSLLVDRSMIEQIVHEGTNYCLILDNYVKGVFTE